MIGYRQGRRGRRPLQKVASDCVQVRRTTFFCGVFQFTAQLLSFCLSSLLAKADMQLVKSIEIAKYFQRNKQQNVNSISYIQIHLIFVCPYVVVIQRYEDTLVCPECTNATISLRNDHCYLFPLRQRPQFAPCRSVQQICRIVGIDCKLLPICEIQFVIDRAPHRSSRVL